VPYSTAADLLTGNIPIPGYLSADKFVADAADEIDSKIGFVYDTPIDVADNSGVVRPAKLLLKRINNFLATGRLLMAAASAGEDTNLHAYALKMVNDATAALEAIVSGDVLLEGATELNPSTDATPKGPRWYNPDTESAVDSFYETLVPVNAGGSRVNGALWWLDNLPATPLGYLPPTYLESGG
jgi:hypothetical protein